MKTAGGKSIIKKQHSINNKEEILYYVDLL